MPYPFRRHCPAGLVNQDRRNAAVETETNLVMCRIYNELRRRLTTDFAWVLEDDMIPRRPDQLERMLRNFHTDVATVSAPYLSRSDPDYVAWRKDAAGKNYRIKRGQGVEQIAGSGFGCLDLRREVLGSYVFQIPTRERWYDPVFFDTAVAPRGRSLIDWDLECEHVGVRRGDWGGATCNAKVNCCQAEWLAGGGQTAAKYLATPRPTRASLRGSGPRSAAPAGS